LARERKPTLGNWLGYWTLVASESLFLSMPWHVGRAVGRRISDVVYLLDRRERKAQMYRNIARVFPHLTGREVRDVARGSYRYLGESTVDARHFHRLAAQGRAQEIIEIEGMELLEDPERKVGVVFVTGHFGAWEVMGIASALLGYPVLNVARRMRNPLIDRHIRSLREAAGETIVLKRGAMYQALRALKAGQNLGFLIDQDARRDGIFVDFLGKAACTTPSPARLAVKTGAPVAFAYARRIGEQNRFRIVIGDVVWPRPGADEREEVYRITQRVTRDLGQVVMRWPTEWMWMHRRWKTRPGKYRPRRYRDITSVD